MQQQQQQYSMINQQEERGLSQSHHKHECQVYDDLSTLMQIFKKLLTSIEEIAFCHQKQTNQQSPHQKLRQFNKTLEVLIRKYTQQSDNFRIQARTFQRFVCRLFETIQIYQLKYRNSSSFQANFIISSLSDIEATFKANDSMHDFVRFIRTVKMIVEKFSHFQFSMTVKSEQPHGGQNDKKISMLDRMDAKMIRLKNINRMLTEKKDTERGESDEEEVDYDEVRSVAVSEKKNNNSLPIAHSISNDLQKRFQLYRCIQLDFSNFKSSYFSAKSNTQNFYRQYLERNIINSRIIKTYNDDFFLFQKKKQIRNHRRVVSNKNSDFSFQSNQSSKMNQSQQFTQSQQLSLKNEKSNKKNKVSIIHNQDYDEQDKMDQPDRNKTSYKMNNVYLTFGHRQQKNQKNQRYYPNITPNILKNRHQYKHLFLNQSSCPKNELSITQSIDLDHSHFKVISGIKASQRIKTSPDRSIPIDLLKRNQIKDPLKLFKQAQHIPFRAVNKRRYLQVDCTSKKEISLNKVILTGNLNARHVKLSKLNEERSNNILF